MTRSGVGAEQISLKGPRDLVTATDLAVEDAIRAILGEALDIPVSGEERGGQVPTDGSAYWLVDPICGTRNFASGIPLWCVNLALVEDDQVTIAVVGDRSTGEIDVAKRGHGAFGLQGGTRRRLASSGESQTIVIEDGRVGGARREQAARFAAGAVRAHRWNLRALGTTLALSYVAAGRIAAYVEFWASAVHLAAGSLLAAEAGAIVSAIDGQHWTIHADSIVASANSELHAELLELAGDTSGRRGLPGRRRDVAGLRVQPLGQAQQGPGGATAKPTSRPAGSLGGQHGGIRQGRPG
jgi:myo-inositol-1(or 4)-monophosphatase